MSATAVPARLSGFRTMFTSFHHFKPEQAQAILADAVRNRCGIGIFEFTYRMNWFLLLLSLIPGNLSESASVAWFVSHRRLYPVMDNSICKSTHKTPLAL